MKKKYLPKPFRERTFIKKIINEKEVFNLEIQSLERIAELDISLSRHFPKIISSFDSNGQLFLELSNCGVSLHDLSLLDIKPIVLNIDEQIENIVGALIKSNIFHLDFNPNGQNICIDDRGLLSLIDFNVVFDNLQGFQSFFEIHPHLKKFYFMWTKSNMNYKDWATLNLKEIVINKCQV